MKLTVETENNNVKSVKIECSPSEALVLNHAMRRYSCDEEVNVENRDCMEQMLEVKPIFAERRAE